MKSEILLLLEESEIHYIGIRIDGFWILYMILKTVYGRFQVSFL